MFAATAIFYNEHEKSQTIANEIAPVSMQQYNRLLELLNKLDLLDSNQDTHT